MPKSKTKAEREHLQRVADLPCVVCFYEYTEVHHLTGAGMGLRSSHFDTIPLCCNHHRGKEGIHTIGKKTWEKKYGTQKKHLNMVKCILGVDT